MPRPCEHNFLDYAFSRVVRACLENGLPLKRTICSRMHRRRACFVLFFPLHGGHFLISKVLPALPIYALPFVARLDQPLQRREAFSLPTSAFILQDASRGGRASGRIKSRGRREPGEWVGELTSCLTAVYDETNLLETNLLVSRHSVCSRVLSNLSRQCDFVLTDFLLPYYPGSSQVVVSKLTYPSLKKPKGYFKRIVHRDPCIQIV